YKSTVAPAGVLVITAGVDVQKNRLEMEVTGWGQGEESWSLDYVVLDGDPERQDVWDQLDEHLERTFTDKDGVELRILCVCIDSGYATQAVYRYVHPRQVRRVYATKGGSEAGKPLVGKPSKRSLLKGLKLYPIGTDTAKDMIYARLKIEDPGPGYSHFPDHYNDEYFAMLTAEKAVIKYVRGTPKREWVQIRTRNEALDARVLSLVALNILSPQWKAVAEKQKKKAAAAKEDQVDPDKKPTKSKRRPQRRRKGKGFIGNW
ncbi:MAG: phage terminase large subunit family protein, partial [bacterium]|nr:phage terminase large subunit family protein [bacterium]